MRLYDIHVLGPPDESEWGLRRAMRDVFLACSPNRREYAREVLTPFLRHGFHRPADPVTLERLVDLAQECGSAAGASFG